MLSNKKALLMKKLINPSTVNGIIQAPSSKSFAQRAVAIASLAPGKSEIFYPGKSDDVIAAIQVCRTLGVNIQQMQDKLIINGGINVPNKPLNCGESGLGIRMFSAIAATLDKPVTLTGSGTLTQRPMTIIEQAVKAMGAECKTNNGYLPITVTGPIKGGVAKVDGSLSSQVITGMLLASPKAQSELIIEVNNLQSKPYIDLTIDIMKKSGVEVENNSYKTFKVKNEMDYQPAKIIVEGDWSGAAFMLVAGAIAGKVRVDNLLANSRQADKVIIDALNLAGAKVFQEDNYVEIEPGNLKGFKFDATQCPDLFPPLVALATYCQGATRIKGVSRLQAKESDRAATLQQEFAKMDVKINIEGEEMVIHGNRPKGATVQSHGDHRIAMACAIATLPAKGNVEITGAEAANKSYPTFFEDLEKLTQYSENF